MSVVISNLTKLYGEQKAIDAISFKAEPGQIVGFLGPNGAGKSTTMKIATTFIPATSGSVQVMGYEVASNPIEVRSAVGYLPESNPLYPEMYVHEYLAFAGRLQGLKGNQLSERIVKMIEISGLGPEQNKKIGQLSKGYKQRVGIAQALIHDPEVLLLDEPTSGLDPNQLVGIRNLIKDLSSEKTVIFSTHIMQEVQAICNRAVIINEGKIVADDTIDNLIAGTTGKQQVVVEFNQEVDTTIFKNQKGIEDFQSRGKNRYVISGKKGGDLRELVFKVSKENNLDLLELKVEEMTMEGIFQKLTGKADDKDPD